MPVGSCDRLMHHKRPALQALLNLWIHIIVNQMATRRIGGEYGEVRAIIDLGKLNQYLSARVPALSSPVTMKQFKVCLRSYPKETLIVNLS